jgi:D-alanyl-D-alanine carboxypeptidase (penicillin-binding protein 5/6)
VLEPLDLPALACASALLVEAETGRVLWEQNADAPRSPASLVKMVLELVVFRELEAGRLALGDSVTTSANASTMGGSQVYLKHGEVQTVAALLDAIVLASANDAAMAIAEHIAGTEAAFVDLMNAEADRLGCRGTRFANVHGLDLRRDSRNVTTARDTALIARALIERPLALELASTWRKPFRGGEFWLDNTNKLLRRYGGLEGYDGLKTGYTPRAGGCLAGTAERDGVRLVSVILGARPGHPRFHITKKLLERGFVSKPRWVRLAAGGEQLRLASADSPALAGPVAVAGGEVRVLVESSRAEALGRRLRPLGELEAPIGAGEALGLLDCRLGDRTFASVPVVAARRLEEIPPLAAVAPPDGSR